MTALDVIHKVDYLVNYQRMTAEQVLAEFKPNSRDYWRAWGCLTAKGLITDPELDDMILDLELDKTV